MIQTNSVNGSMASAYSGGATSQLIGHEEFLTLLVTQLKNQDPLAPMESHQFTSQLAQISSLEQLVSIDGNIEDGISADMVLSQAINNTLAATLIGRDVTAIGNSIELKSGESTDIHFSLAGFAEEVEVQVYDQAGNLVRTIEAGALASGKHSVAWDGENDNGEEFPEGNYSFSVKAKDASGGDVATRPLVVGLISSVRFEGGSAVLMVNGREIAFSSVLEIGINS